MSRTERYAIEDDLANDIKRHDNPNHQGHFKNVLNLQIADEQLQEYETGTDAGNYTDVTDSSGADTES